MSSTLFNYLSSDVNAVGGGNPDEEEYVARTKPLLLHAHLAGTSRAKLSTPIWLQIPLAPKILCGRLTSALSLVTAALIFYSKETPVH